MFDELQASSDPGACSRYFTQNLLEQASKRRGRAAVLSCEEQVLEDPSPDEEMTVSGIEVDGGEGTADVASEGGTFDGQKIRYRLVEQDGAWKVDEMLEFIVFDRDKLILEMGRSWYRDARTRAELDAVSCSIDRLLEADDAALQEVFLGRTMQPLLELVQACEPRSAAV